MDNYGRPGYVTPRDLSPWVAEMPYDVREALGIGTVTGHRAFLHELMNRNDRGDSFDQIAGYIESYFAGEKL